MPYLPNRRFRPGNTYPTRSPNYRPSTTQYGGFGAVSGDVGGFNFQDYLRKTFGGGPTPVNLPVRPSPAPATQRAPSPARTGGNYVPPGVAELTGAGPAKEGKDQRTGLGGGGFLGTIGDFFENRRGREDQFLGALGGLRQGRREAEDRFLADPIGEAQGFVGGVQDSPLGGFVQSIAQGLAPLFTQPIGRTVADFLAPEPGTQLSQGFDTELGGIAGGAANLIDFITNFEFPGTQQFAGGARPGNVGFQSGQGQSLEEYLAGQAGMTVDEYRRQQELLEDTGALESPITLDLEWERFWDAIGQAVSDKYQPGDETQASGFGGGGFGGFGGGGGGGGFSFPDVSNDPRFWLDAVRWLIS